MILLLAAILVPFIAALACLATSARPQLSRWVAVAGAAGLCMTSIGLLMETSKAGFIVMQAGAWAAPFGITLVADVFSAMMVAVTGVVALCVAVYAMRDINDALIRKHYFALFHFLLMGVNGAFITGDLFNLYVWFEVMLLASFVLITMEGKRSQLEGGVKYLVINLFSSILFLSGVGLIYGKLGTLNMADIALQLQSSPDALLVKSSAMLLLAAFGVKAAMFPFFFWLPASYHTPRFTTSALFAGLLTKVGVYALIRMYTLLFGAHFEVVQDILIWLAALTMITGVLGAAAQFEVRKILSFHIVSQIGYMVMGLAIGTSLAIAGAVFYVIHHIIVKTNLFLIAGIIQEKTGTNDLKKTGGLYRWAPGIALLFFVPAFSLGGIPPLSGFWAKYSVVKAGLDAERYVLVTAALLVGVMTLFSMTKIWAEAFWKDNDKQKAETGLAESTTLTAKLSPCLVLPVLSMVIMTLFIGLWSEPLFALAQQASEQLLNPDAYIGSVLNPGEINESVASNP